MKENKTNKIKPSILPGFMELTPKEQLLFNDLVTKMTAVYERNGCLPMDTPIIEKEEILLAKSQGETSKQIYQIAGEEKKQALRFDLTVPFARFVAQYMYELVFPFKRYQFGKVYRGERNQKGRYKEFYQLDVDIVGKGQLDMRNDAYVLSLASEAFATIGLREYTFQMSNRKILIGLLETLEITEPQPVLTLIDKYDKMGKEACLESIAKEVGETKCKSIEAVLTLEGEAEGVIKNLKTINERLEKEATYSPCFGEGIREVEEVVNTMKIFGVEEKNYEIALKIIRGLDYYTGTIFETVLKGNESYGSICSGGRYDQLAQLYTDVQIPGVGISIGVTRLFFVLKEIGFFQNREEINEVDYLILPLGDTLEECVDINRQLQQAGYKTELYLDRAPLKKQLNYANARKIKQVILVGEDEVKQGIYRIKNMETGEQTITLAKYTQNR